MTVKRLYVAALVLAALGLVVLNGFQTRTGFRVDQTSVWLLVGMALPVLAQFVEEVRAGGMQLTLRKLNVYDQILLIIPEIGRTRTWTFYPSRAGEHDVGDAFRLTFEVLLQHNREKLLASLRRWLASNDRHLSWLAAEVAGYFKIAEVKDELPVLYADAGVHETWERWQLNALWARSRFNDYRELQEMLLTTKNPQNQEWLLFVYPQMITEDPSPAGRDKYLKLIDDFLSYNSSVSERTRQMAVTARGEIERIVREASAAAA